LLGISQNKILISLPIEKLREGERKGKNKREENIEEIYEREEICKEVRENER